MFWRFNYLSSDIDTLLDKENVTLQEILNEDDVLQECKAQNKKLVDFLVQSQHLVELVRYVTEPTDDVIDKLKFKYPNIACELLTSDVNQITDALATDQMLLEKIMTFVKSDGMLNPLQTSLFGKVVGLLITRKSEVVVEYIKSHEGYVDHILHHFGTSAIMDMLMRLITSMESTECRNSCITFLMSQGIVSKLVALISPSKSPEINANAAQTLCDLICLGREQIIQLGDQVSPDPLLAEIESQETVTQLLTHMFDSTEPVESSVVCGLQVIQTLLEFRKTTLEGFTDPLSTAENSERFSQAISNTVQALVPRLKCFHNLLISPPKQHYVPMPWTLGVLEHPLGNTRLQISRLIATLLCASSSAVNEELESLGTVNILLDLYFEFSWNNFLHRQVELCVSAILMNDSSDNSLLTQLLTSYQLTQRITKAFEDNQKQQSTVGGCRQGYMGHLTRIANNLINNTVNSKNSQKIDDLVLSLPEDVRDSWDRCKSGPLAEINKRNLCDLISSSSVSIGGGDDDEFSRIAFPQATVSQKFGYNEDEFNEPDDDSLGFGESRLSLSPSSGNNDVSAAMFEDQCTRMGQFDHGDTNADEDLWVDKEITFSSTAVADPTSPSSHPIGGQSSSGRMVVSDPDTDDDDDDDEDVEKRHSSDSDEDELPSLPRIHQLPDSDAGSRPINMEDMDVTPADDWAKFDEVPMEVAPDVTQPLPWMTESSPGTTDPAADDWANFDGAQPVATKLSSADDGWADFAAFSDSPALGSEAESSSCKSPTSLTSRIASYVVPSSGEVSSEKSDFDGSFTGVCPDGVQGDNETVGGQKVVLNSSAATENGPS